MARRLNFSVFVSRMSPKIGSIESQRIAARHTDVLKSLYRVSLTLGLLGLFLPTILIVHGLFWNGGLQPSISHTYHTSMGDVLVGTLFAIGIFLLAYKDFNPEEYVNHTPDRFLTSYWDRWFSRLAGLGAIGVALFPVDPMTIENCSPIVQSAPNLPCSTGGMTWQGYVSLTLEGGEVVNLMHFLSAGLFFFCIFVICVRFFPEEPIRAKYIGRNADGEFQFEFRLPTRRTVFFTTLGLLIGLCVFGLAYMTARAGTDSFLIPFLEKVNGFFWLEVIAVVVFAIAWIAKSRDFDISNLPDEGVNH